MSNPSHQGGPLAKFGTEWNRPRLGARMRGRDGERKSFRSSLVAKNEISRVVTNKATGPKKL
jgi:hypothetical protein